MPIVFCNFAAYKNNINNKNKNIMKKAFNFVESLTSPFFDLMGYPTIKVLSDIVEVYFDCKETIRDLEILDLSGYDDMRFFANGDCITFVFTFYNND